MNQNKTIRSKGFSAGDVVVAIKDYYGGSIDSNVIRGKTYVIDHVNCEGTPNSEKTYLNPTPTSNDLGWHYTNFLHANLSKLEKLIYGVTD